jgi:hypothetical protein
MRPSMYMRDFDLRDLELQLHGFDAGLVAAEAFGEFESFNRAFSDFVLSTTKLSCSQGWATALLRKFGQNESTFQKFLSLLEKATIGDQSRSNT